MVWKPAALRSAGDYPGTLQSNLRMLLPPSTKPAPPAGATPLIWAVRMNSEAWVRRLLAANADPTIEDRSPFAAMWGATALDNAEKFDEMGGAVTQAKAEENQRIIELLSEGGAHAGASAA